MTSLTSYLNKLLLFALACWLLAGCSAARPVAPTFAPVIPVGGPLIAVFPMENLSGMPAPLREIQAELIATAQRSGMRLVDSAEVDRFIERHWVRSAGGIDEATATALNQETGADAVLITSLELYSEVFPPRMALLARLVTTGTEPVIVWMDSVSISGDDAPGFLGLGMIDDQRRLQQLVLQEISASLERYITNPPLSRQRPLARTVREQKSFTLDDMIERIKQEQQLLSDPSSDRQKGYTSSPESKPKTVEEMISEIRAGSVFQPLYFPSYWYSSRDKLDEQLHAIAITPFIEDSTHKHGADLVTLHLTKQLVSNGRYKVLELGVVRDRMLKMHIILKDGISIPSIDLLSNALGVEMIMSGKVFDFKESLASASAPIVDFSVQIYQRDTHKILWSSHSHNRGDDAVFFFDWGRLNTASALTARMSRALVKEFVENASTK